MGERPERANVESGDPFAARLRRAREAAGLSQEELAGRAGLSGNAVGGLERGEHRHPYPATVRALAAALGMTDTEQLALVASVPRRDRAHPTATIAVPGLPSALSPLVGRERELAEIGALLRCEEVRLVTLTGPGGVGKTRLALALATELAGEFADDAAFVSLAAIRDGGLVAPAIANGLGLALGGDRVPAERLGAAFGTRHLLLVLDNFEQVLDAAPLVTDLLARCPCLTVLVTSRVVLRLAGEHVVPVAPLAVPDPDHLPVVEQLGGIAAVRLFSERARAADPGFALTDANAGPVAAVCHRLDGLPLAIELAAARIAVLAPEAMLPRLARRLPLLTAGRRDAPDRHRTMRDAIAWSHDLLLPDQQVLFQRLAVFVGGFTLDAAERVMGHGGWVIEGDAPIPPAGHDAHETRQGSTLQSPSHFPDGPSSSALDGIAALVDASLVQPDRGPTGRGRFLMLETIREYGLERLAAAGEADRARAVHAACFVDWDERLDPNATAPGERVEDRLRQIDAEHPNLRAALIHLKETADAEGVLRLAGSLAVYWHHREHLAEGRGWLEWALARTGDAPTVWRGRALAGLSLVAWSQGDYATAGPLAEQAIAVADIVDDRDLAALAVHLLGINELARGRLERAQKLMQTALDLQRDLDQPADGSMALMTLSEIAVQRGDSRTATVHAEEALAIFRRLGHPSGAAGSLSILARLALDRGDDDQAAAAYRGVLRLWPALVAANTAAAEHFGFPSRTNVIDRRSVVRALIGLACLAAAHGQPAVAATLVGAGAVRAGQPTSPGAEPNRAHPERVAEAARAALGEARFAELWERGRELPLATAVAMALEVTIPEPPAGAPAPTNAQSGIDALTARELDVLRLLVEGRSNAEIAEALFVSVRTARAHVASILANLGLPTRTAAAVHALNNHLV